LADHADQLPAVPHRLAPVVGAALIAILLWAVGLALWASPAVANDRFNLDPNTESVGNLIEDPAGNAYVGWMDSANGGTAMFCKIPAGGTCTHPQTLPIPGPGNVPDAVLPVFGSGSTVYAVGPGYIDHSVVIWTSTNGGESFGAGTVDTSGYPSMGQPNTVLLSGSNFLIGASHVGAGIGETPTDGLGGSSLTFKDPSLYSLDATLGLAGPGDPVEAYWEFVNSSPIQFYRYKGSGSLTSETDWAGPELVTAGEDPRLTGGAGGLFLLSADIAGSGEPEAVDVRKYAGTTFGAPVTLFSGPSFGAQDGGAIAESPAGQIAVAWPTGSGSSERMQLFTSTDGGLSFGSVGAIARIGEGYETGVNAQMTLSDAGGGWLTYRDSEGLQVADLSPLVEPTSTGSSSGNPAPPAKSVPAPPAESVPAPYGGATKTTTTAVGGELLTLKVPKACLAAAQPFYVGVGKEKRHRIAKQLHTSINVSKVTFTFDGLKKTLKKKPFRWLIRPPVLAAGHPYIVKARVTVSIDKHGVKKKLVKTLEGQVSLC
jgi:hypothetical protein